MEPFVCALPKTLLDDRGRQLLTQREPVNQLAPERGQRALVEILEWLDLDSKLSKDRAGMKLSRT